MNYWLMKSEPGNGSVDEQVLRKSNRLSIMPVEAWHWQAPLTVLAQNL